VAFANFGDVLDIEASAQYGLKYEGPFADQLGPAEQNLITRAAEMMNHTDVSITLHKNIPVAAGIGGGSADAAACLRGLGQLYNKRPSLDEALRLGADVPVCLAQKPSVMRGIGEDIAPITNMPDLPIVLVNPALAVATQTIFSMLERKENAALPPLPETDNFNVWVEYIKAQRNDLMEPAITFAPVIGDVLNAFSDAAVARMSGSGATCFGIFKTQNDAVLAAQDIQARHPDWWVTSCMLSGC